MQLEEEQMPNKNAPKPDYYPPKGADSDTVWNQAAGITILSDEAKVRDGGPGRTKRTDTMEQKDKEDAYGN
jgi:hypothetical protein